MPPKTPKRSIVPLIVASVVLSALGTIASPAGAAVPRSDTAENALLDPL